MSVRLVARSRQVGARRDLAGKQLQGLLLWRRSADRDRALGEQRNGLLQLDRILLRHLGQDAEELPWWRDPPGGRLPRRRPDSRRIRGPHTSRAFRTRHGADGHTQGRRLDVHDSYERPMDAFLEPKSAPSELGPATSRSHTG